MNPAAIRIKLLSFVILLKEYGNSVKEQKIFLMRFYLLVAAGSALGGMLRYWLSGFVQKISLFTFPYGTLAVNILGTFILGLVIFYFDLKELISPEVKLFLTIGFCGGLTTFSTFSFETFNLLRDSEYLLATTNILLNLFLTLFALVLSFYIARLFNGV